VFKKVIAPIIISATLLGGVAIAGNAYASAPAATAQGAAHSTAASTQPGAHHPLRAWLRAHRRQIRRAGVAISAQTIGVTPQDLATELRSGKSIADVADEHNVSAQKVVNALVAAADSTITTAVSDHKLDSTRAAKIEAAVPAWVTKAVDHTF
jgi:hypothetical protein